MILGIDIGGTTTDIVGLLRGSHIDPLTVRADDALASAAGALGKFVSLRCIKLAEISTLAITGVGAGKIGGELLGIPTVHVSEFRAIGTGGAYLSGIKKAIVVSMGTGTAVVHVDGDTISHWGGTGVGGGTVIGLAKRALGISSYESILKRAAKGTLDTVDLFVDDIADPGLFDLPARTTASNFGKTSDEATDDDVALAIVNMVCQTIGVVAAGAARATGTHDIVLTGKLAVAGLARSAFDSLSSLYNVTFIVPDHAEFATAFGAAVSEA